MKPSLALAFALLALVPLAFGQNFTVELTPLSAVVLPDTGGTISYRVTVTNNETVPRTADVWVKTTMPNSSTKPGPGPITQTFLGNQTLTWERGQTLLPASPVGYYTLHAYVGLYPNTIWTQTDLECQKQMLTGGVEQVWVARYTGTGPYGDQPRDLAVDAEGNVYVTGWSYSPETMTDYVTVKYDAAGNQLWVTRYNGPGNAYDEATSLAIDTEGNVYVAGASYGNGTWWDYATIKYDAAGIQQWVARYNGDSVGYDKASSLALDGDANVYVTGVGSGSGSGGEYITIKYNDNGVRQWVAHTDGLTLSSDFEPKLGIDLNGNSYVTCSSYWDSTSRDYTTIKYNPAGLEQWQVRYNGPGNSFDYAMCLAVGADGNVHVTGNSAGSGTGDDYATVKYDASGVQQWEARYNGPVNSSDRPYGLAVDTSGNVYVTGYSVGSGSGWDIATVKYSPSGMQFWVAHYNGIWNSDDVAWDLKVDRGGNVFVTGISSNSYSDYVTIKYDSDGIQQWVAQYNGPDDELDQALKIALDSFGNVYVTGNSAGNGTYSDYCTIKYSQPAVPNWQPVTATMLGAPLPQECRLEAPSPNPFNLTTALSYKLQAPSPVSLRVYDTAGRLVTTLVNGWREAGTHEVTFDGSMLASGMYFVKIQAGEYAGVQKLVLLK